MVKNACLVYDKCRCYSEINLGHLTLHVIGNCHFIDLNQTGIIFLQGIFQYMSTVNSDMYFLCGLENFKELATLIDHIDLPLRVRYQFCLAPVSVKSPFLSTLFTKVLVNTKYDLIDANDNFRLIITLF